MKKKAFTLVELLIVVVIMGILATFVVLMLGNATKKTRDARAKRSIESVRDAIEQYVAANEDVALNGPSTGNGFGAATITVSTGSSIDTKLKAGGATGFSSDPDDARSNPVKVKFTAAGYTITGQSSNSNNKCWYVIKDDNGTITNNFSDTPPTANCL